VTFRSPSVFMIATAAATMPSLVSAGLAGRSRGLGLFFGAVMPPTITNMFVTNKFVAGQRDF
jgi:hypothetical protein